MSIDPKKLSESLTRSKSAAMSKSATPTTKPRGLADRPELESLALTYLEEQRKHWPDLVERGILSSPTPEVLASMAERFEQVYRGDEPPVHDTRSLPEGIHVSAAYARYSDSNSNPRSLNQQLINILAGAARDQQFVPWDYVFADAATTATNDNRRGYQLLIQLIRRNRSAIEVVYIDELGRANRDTIASLTLGREIEGNKKRLVGVTDGFDSSNPMSRMQLTIFAMVHESFVDQLRDKVDRGMIDAFNQGKPLYNPGYGYSLTPKLDSNGIAIKTGDGKYEQEIVINEEEAAQVRRIFQLYTFEKKSTATIARLLNSEQVGNRSWTDAQVRILLHREMYQGREPWNKSSKQFDHATGKNKTLRNPQEQWRWREMPHLRIIDRETWEATQARHKKLSNAYTEKERKGARLEANPKRLFSFVCGDCGGPMWSSRGGDRALIKCHRGFQGLSGCAAMASKTLKQIEDSLLNHILFELASDSFVDDLVSHANAYLSELASMPAVDVEPIKILVRKKQAALDRILERLERVEDSLKLDKIFLTVDSLEKEIDELNQTIKQAGIDKKGLTPIKRDDIFKLVGSLRDLLYSDVSVASPILQSITGPVTLTQLAPKPGKKRPEWTAEFMLCHAKALVEIARQIDCPSRDTLEFLSERSWTFGESRSTMIRSFGNAERIAKTVVEMLSAGTSRGEAAVALQVEIETIDEAAAYWAAGKRCYLPPKDFTFRRTLPGAKVDKIAEEVVRLFDVEGMSINGIAKQLGVNSALVSRAYKQSKSELLLTLAKEGKPLKLPVRLKLSAEVHAKIRQLLEAGGKSYRQIAREVGCDHHAVSDAHKRLLAEKAA